jgi:hypothetical protein
VPRLHVAFIPAFPLRALFDLALQRADAHDVGTIQVAAVDPRLQLGQELSAQIHVAGDRPGLDERLAFPCPPEDVVVVQGRTEGDHRRALPAFGPQPQVHAVRRAQGRALRQVLDHLAGQPIEELAIGDRARAVGLAGVVAEENQVDVAGVVQLPAAQLAQGQHGEAGGLPVRPSRRAALLDQLAACGADGSLDDRVRQKRDLLGHDPQPLPHHDVAVRDPQRLPVLVPAEDRQDIAIVVQLDDFRTDFLQQHAARHRLAFRQAQQIEALRIPNQQIAQVLARGEDLQQRRQGVGIALEQRPQGQRVTGRREETVQVIQRHVRIADATQVLVQLLAEDRQEIGGQTRLGDLQEVALSARRVPNPQGP